MTRLLASLALLFSIVFGSAAQNGLSPFRLDDREGKAFHHIHFNNLLEGDSCSSTAIGKHALLTATHCEIGTDQVEVDGTNYDIAARVRDGNDHTILVLPKASFATYLQLDQRNPLEHERIRGWGWPGNVPDVVYKEGYFIKEIGLLQIGKTGWLFAFPIFAGDSGGGVVTEDGKVITVVSLGDDAAHMVCFPLAFTPAQLSAI